MTESLLFYCGGVGRIRGERDVGRGHIYRRSQKGDWKEDWVDSAAGYNDLNGLLLIQMGRCSYQLSMSPCPQPTAIRFEIVRFDS